MVPNKKYDENILVDIPPSTSGISVQGLRYMSGRPEYHESQMSGIQVFQLFCCMFFWWKAFKEVVNIILIIIQIFTA